MKSSSQDTLSNLKHLATTQANIEGLSADLCALSKTLNKINDGMYLDIYQLKTLLADVMYNPEHGFEKIRCEISQIVQSGSAMQILRSVQIPESHLKPGKHRRRATKDNITPAGVVRQPPLNSSKHLCQYACKMTKDIYSQLYVDYSRVKSL
ncbi:hypothetical protein HELRODRAFT_168781 [Helobdella robusta]|uniref:Uncharacterized protein n=1 Tax=Helobdella robusta TaxID=6412 RepID=T1F0Y6_HELRO|nr:hypothetical protein HELRODRAFT_168781 [Helobdella robusta]ESO08864.1 hypothetical protein HELRODRAFT_168781 [Helobdella robusta]